MNANLTMKTNQTPSTDELSASEQIDAIIQEPGDWRGERLAHLRAVILEADPGATEEVKWKKPSKPSGVPVWSHNGNLCVADTLKNAVRLTFPKGAQIDDPSGMFNKRLDSKTVRAIDFYEGEGVDEAALTDIVRAAVSLNAAKERTQKKK